MNDRNFGSVGAEPLVDSDRSQTPFSTEAHDCKAADVLARAHANAEYEKHHDLGLQRTPADLVEDVVARARSEATAGLSSSQGAYAITETQDEVHRLQKLQKLQKLEDVLARVQISGLTKTDADAASKEVISLNFEC